VHHAYNAYTNNLIEALTEQRGFSVHQAKVLLRSRLERLYNAYLELLPMDRAVALVTA
jgi:hypothetical protein